MNTVLRQCIGPWVDAGLGFLYPEVCRHCDGQRATPLEGYVCAECRAAVRWIKPPFCERCGLQFEGDIQGPFECANCREMELHFVHARSAAAAKGVVLEVIHRYKYNRELWFEPFLADLLAQAACPPLQREGWNLIVPVPLHPLKYNEREFNQAERLGRCLSRASGIPLNPHALRRIQPTRTQTRLSRLERADNVRSAFVSGNEGNIQGRRIVLVDDVLTTGATTSACARVLKEAGAASVCVWTVARGLLH